MQVFRKCIKFIAYSALIIFLLPSCKWFKPKAGEEGVNPVARVYEKFLYESDLKGVGTHAATPEDSIQAIRNYIDSWIRHELILHYAQENLPEQMDDIDKQVEKYRQSLIIYAYEKELIAQKLDTVVSQKEIQDYFDSHHDAFSLKTGIFNVQFIKLKTAPKRLLDSAKVWFKKPNDINDSKLRNFCAEYAVKSVLNDSTWFIQEDLEKILPIRNIDWEDIAFNRKYAEVTDSIYLNMIKVNNYKFKGANAPLNYVRDDIYNIIINRRKLDYISQVHNTIYDDALKNKKFEILNEPK